MKMKSLSLTAAAVVAMTVGASSASAAELRVPVANAIASPIPSQYIVVLDRKAMAASVGRDGLRGTVQNLLTRVGGGEVIAEYGSALLGFAARISRVQAEALARQPGVTSGRAGSGDGRRTDHHPDRPDLGSRSHR